MRLKALDTVHISSVQAEPLLADTEFDVEDGAGRSLVARGLAVEVKAAAPHENKMEPAPANKADRPLSAKQKKRK